MPGATWHHSDPRPTRTQFALLLEKLLQNRDKPLLFVDIDGVISLFGFPPEDVPPRCSWHQVDGIVHLLSHEAAEHLLVLADLYEPIWCTGWQERANEHLPYALGLGPFPHLSFGDSPLHWKLAAVQARAGDRPLAWIDDDLNDAVRDWARRRSCRVPTLLVETEPATGLTGELGDRLRRWAAESRESVS